QSLIDHSGNGYHATLQSTANVEWVSGIEGLGLSLNGWANRFAKLPHQNGLEFTEKITISAWVRPNALHKGTIVSKADGNGFEFWLDSNGQLEFRLNRGNNGSQYRMRSTYNYSGDIGKWVHLAATFDGTTMRVFVNGQEDKSQSFTPFTIGTNSGDLVIGALGTIQRLNGSLDELRLYNRALDPAEILLLANG
ncbi:LamG domain-containing protein, partial [Mariniradius saccharolyticus]|uniref:LamG domain-containing protein n=1 Tax=Mariniradius saccharolyticus TaxID=1245591 RepID=UPI00058DE5A3